MQKILLSEEMREVDRLTTEKYGIPSLILMENAAHAVARSIADKFSGNLEGKSVLVLCGKGNNGGDGAALARILWSMGAKVCLILFGKVDDTNGDARINFEICEKCLDFFYEFETQEAWEKWYWEDDFSWEIIVDALFGTGLNRPIDNWLVNVIQHLNILRENSDKERLIVSIDIPSGLNSDLATQIGENITADLTVTFTAPKIANIFPPNSNFNGELISSSIGSPQELIDNCSSKLFVTEKADVKDWLYSTKLQSSSYKKTRGTALIIAGSENYSGAAVLAANACFSAGAGMVTLAVPKVIHPIAASKTLDEVIVKPIENVRSIETDVVAVGCGLSDDDSTQRFISDLVESRQTPMIIDAEALNSLSPFNLQGSDDLPLILTPHIGEFSRLLGREVGENKILEVSDFAQQHNVILVLKGEKTLIAKPDGTVVINPTGNSGVSRAGGGDTLTGIITSFLAQTFAVRQINLENAFEAVISAIYVAGLAGDLAAEKYDARLITATDVRNSLVEAMEKFDK